MASSIHMRSPDKRPSSFSRSSLSKLTLRRKGAAEIKRICILRVDLYMGARRGKCLEQESIGVEAHWQSTVLK